MTEVLPLEAELENFIRRHWRQYDEVADLRQEVLTRLYRFALENRPTQPRALMFRIARNLMIDRIRKKSVVTIDAVMDFESLSVSTDEADPFETTSARQELRMLQDALDDLPQRTRDVIFMRRVQGCSQRETAKKLKISEPTVERHISKGVTLLMEYFRRHGVVRSAGKTRKSEARRDDFA